jgi:hypothetical protein
MQDQYVQPTQVDGANPDVSIAAGSVTYYLARFPYVTTTRTAVTPIVTTHSSIMDVFYWTISSSGKISKPTLKAQTTDVQTTVTAACMLPGNVPMSVYMEQIGSSWDVEVGLFGFTGQSDHDVVGGLGSGIINVAAAAAGDDFNVFNPYGDVSAYFITAALTTKSQSPSTSAPGVYRLQKWSYPVTLPIT